MSKRVHLIILALTALVCSKGVFFFFNDPEGPNLLVVIVLAIALYLPAWGIYSFFFLTKTKKFTLAILAQVAIAYTLYLLF